MKKIDNPKSQKISDHVKKKFGFVPNVLAELSASPAALQVYLSGQEHLTEGALTPVEQQVVQLTVASFNHCQYCQAAHQFLGKQVGLSLSDIQAIREGRAPEHAEAAFIRRVTWALLEKRGWMAEEQVREWETLGLTKEKLYEIVAYVGLKTITNYVNHMAHTPVDDVFNV